MTASERIREARSNETRKTFACFTCGAHVHVAEPDTDDATYADCDKCGTSGVFILAQ